MYRELLHIWGPFSINSYGLCIALGLTVFIILIYRHPLRKQYVTDDQLYQAFFIGIIATLFGGRLLYILENWDNIYGFWQFFEIWNGGLSILGGIISCLIAIVLYIKSLGLPVLLLMDIPALYAPLAQACGRFGCFMAGCCHGLPFDGFWAVTYSDPLSFAPLSISLHPTQLYSVLIFLGIFWYMQAIANRYALKPGTLLLLYLMLSSLERYFVDFWRADREFVGPEFFRAFSLHQWIAITIAGVSALVLTIKYSSSENSTRHESV